MATDYRTVARRHGVEAQATILVSAGLLAAWSLAWVGSKGFEQGKMAIAFCALVALGEAARVGFRGARVQAPLSLSASLGYALLAFTPGARVMYDWPQVVVVCLVGTVAGAFPHLIVGRRVSVLSLARRLLLVGLVAASYHALLRAVWSDRVDQPPMWAQALMMVAVLMVGLGFDISLRAGVLASQGQGRFWRQCINEGRATIEIQSAVMATAMVLALATSQVGLEAVPVVSVPLLLTQLSYRRYHLARTTYAQTVEALSKTTDVAGYTVPGHARRVADLSLAIGNDFGLSPDELRRLEYAALLHDVGQMSLPEPLAGGATIFASYEQRAAIAKAGADLIADSGIPGDLATLVARQSEPFRRGSHSGQTPTPVQSRIINVANAFDDLVGEPVSITASTDAVQRITLGLADDYDPKVVQALTRYVARLSEVPV
jgi:HD domain